MLRRPTELLRATVSQEIRCVLLAENGAPENSLRRVQVLVPMEPKVLLSLQEHADDAFGTDRSYKMVVAPPGAQLEFGLLPSQTLYAAADVGMAELGLIVEYTA